MPLLVAAKRYYCENFKGEVANRHYNKACLQQFRCAAACTVLEVGQKNRPAGTPDPWHLTRDPRDSRPATHSLEIDPFLPTFLTLTTSQNCLLVYGRSEENFETKNKNSTIFCQNFQKIVEKLTNFLAYFPLSSRHVFDPRLPAGQDV